MYFDRTFTSGALHDPRSKTWAEFKCPVCGEDTQIDITGRQATFDFTRERICPHCHQKSPEDALINLKTEIDKLTQEQSRIAVQIEELTRQYEELSSIEKKE